MFSASNANSQIAVIETWCNCWRIQLALSAVQVLTLHWETLLSKTLLDEKMWFPSVRFLSSCFCICNLYLTPTSCRHLLTRGEPWNQSFDKDMECLWSLARLLAKEKTDMNTHQKIARCNVFYMQCKPSISSVTYMRIWFVSYLLCKYCSVLLMSYLKHV